MFKSYTDRLFIILFIIGLINLVHLAQHIGPSNSPQWYKMSVFFVRLLCAHVFLCHPNPFLSLSDYVYEPSNCHCSQCLLLVGLLFLCSDAVSVTYYWELTEKKSLRMTTGYKMAHKLFRIKVY